MLINVILKDGTHTIREESEIRRDFVNSKEYDYCKSGLCSNIEPIVKEWINENFTIQDGHHAHSLYHELVRYM